jgi:hypothetical protein
MYGSCSSVRCRCVHGAIRPSIGHSASSIGVTSDSVCSPLPRTHIQQEAQDLQRRAKAYKKSLCDLVRELMLAKASKYLLAELQSDENREALMAGTG